MDFFIRHLVYFFFFFSFLLPGRQHQRRFLQHPELGLRLPEILPEHPRLPLLVLVRAHLHRRRRSHQQLLAQELPAQHLPHHRRGVRAEGLSEWR